MARCVEIQREIERNYCKAYQLNLIEEVILVDVVTRG